MAKILTIDLGTSSFKLALFDRRGTLLDLHRLVSPASGPRPGWSEIPAAQFEATLETGVAALRDRDPQRLADVAAVTFATQANSFLLYDAHDRPLTPIILWSDQRAQGEIDLAGAEAMPGFNEITGLSRLGPPFMLAKLLWLRRHAPDLSRQAQRLGLVSDYLTFLLTGRHVTEAGVAGLTGLLDVGCCQWWPDMLDHMEISHRFLPDVVRAGTDLGPLTAAAAARFHLPRSCRVVVGCLDQYAGAIGLGAVTPGMIAETTGTVLAAVQCVARGQAAVGHDIVQGPSFDDGLAWQMAFCDVSANYLAWYRAQLPEQPDYDQLIATAAPIAPGADGLRLNTAAVRGKPSEVFVGMTPQHTPGHAVRCILEAVADALRQQVARLSGGDRPPEMRCAGGGARSDLWLQIKADMLGIAMTAGACPEPTSLGAAILAETALAHASVPQVAAEWVCLQPAHVPNPMRLQTYRLLRDSYLSTCQEPPCTS